ncbi:MAG: beta-N-acetylhexosaminidase [Gammaproteobacteria bacterium]|jgi:beta-N-acetylhexosaminidase
MSHDNNPLAIRGQVMLDVEGTVLTDEDRARLAHPATGGVILFSRNYASREQVAALVTEIREVSPDPLLIAVDHEGGRVQRFREGFTHIPPMAWLGKRYDTSREEALNESELLGWLMATELRQVDIDFSFAPVLDLGLGVCDVIGDRAFHRDPDVIALLARRFMQGMHDAGMSAVGKHFPGHGAVVEDSHVALPIDQRDLEVILDRDVRPFAKLITFGLDGIMPAHVIYTDADQNAAGFSPFWLREILRERLGFEGVIFSDDLTMAAAASAGDYGDRARAAIDAGCDMVVVCNDPDAAGEVLDAMEDVVNEESLLRLASMAGSRTDGSDADNIMAHAREVAASARQDRDGEMA